MIELTQAATDNGVNAALITAGGVVIGAFLALLGVIWTARRRARTNTVDPPQPPVTPNPLSTFSGTQNEFMALVMKDNEAQRGDVSGLRTEFTEFKQQTGEQLKALQQTLKDEQARATRYRKAVTRFLTKLRDMWGEPGPFPAPDDEDLEVLAETLPAAKLKRSRTTTL